MIYRLLLIFSISIITFFGCKNRSDLKKEGKIISLGNHNDKRISIEVSTKEGKYYLFPKVLIGDQVVFTDTSPAYYNLQPGYIKLISLDNDRDQYYILLDISDPILSDKWRILSIRFNRLIGQYSAIRGILSDIDGDGYIEVGGIEVSEGYCLNCDSDYYNPYHIYKLGRKFEFDQKSSEILTKQLYGTYLGNDRKDTLLRIKKVNAQSK